MNSGLESILSIHLNWATGRGIKINDGYTLNLSDNLFQTMLEETTKEFKSGKGSELGSNGIAGKMQALHSSSALVVNFFEYWRNRKDVSFIAKSCGGSDNLEVMNFEATHRNPVGRMRPHLDLEFTDQKGSNRLAIESKFTESYHRKTKRTLSTSYLKHKEIWEKLRGCQRLALRIAKEESEKTSFEYLDAPQLIKHILGLSTDCTTTGFKLLYLWYEIESREAEKHREEIIEFQSYVKEEVDFSVMTYQQLFSKIQEKKEKYNEDYFEYLKERYFKER